ncbi:oligopeptide/dipeptide ABC transporter ATP-binding protein [Humitalea rosea]|uniref:Oligopeptide/dipeptide ABC transporter ATP-binding protein n=1 Tax=Humitalea rosea TaxID=990373 RepID=A0A2W7IT58_9PROT|nr:ABC transporter ATP-binding protein [Humitalea rosea]PZW51026.1 oligopeptide/dipeptide ABC transporter ATP-binding protein [Humitalea rosea]
MTPALAVTGLTVSFATDRGVFRAVDGLSFSVAPGETLAIVGESGCGKSVSSLAIMGLLEGNARVGGDLRLAGQDLLAMTPEARRKLRGADMAMIFQEPMTSLNPAFCAGNQIAEVLALHRGLSRHAAYEEAIRALDQVRIPDARRRAAQYPHQLSGGMRQRVMIAMALACRPKLLIADEPTTALDVTVQAQILELLDELKRETGTAIVLITHDLGVVADHAEQVVVMYAGRAVETAPGEAIFTHPEHPYTIGLLGAAPRLDGPRGRLASIEGTVPDPMHRPPGCGFAPRCPFAVAECTVTDPALTMLAPGHAAACLLAPLEAA